MCSVHNKGNKIYLLFVKNVENTVAFSVKMPSLVLFYVWFFFVERRLKMEVCYKKHFTFKIKLSSRCFATTVSILSVSYRDSSGRRQVATKEAQCMAFMVERSGLENMKTIGIFPWINLAGKENIRCMLLLH